MNYPQSISVLRRDNDHVCAGRPLTPLYLAFINRLTERDDMKASALCRHERASSYINCQLQEDVLAKTRHQTCISTSWSRALSVPVWVLLLLSVLNPIAASASF